MILSIDGVNKITLVSMIQYQRNENEIRILSPMYIWVEIIFVLSNEWIRL